MLRDRRTVAGLEVDQLGHVVAQAGLGQVPGVRVLHSSLLIGRAPTLLRSHWSRAAEC